MKVLISGKGNLERLADMLNKYLKVEHVPYCKPFIKGDHDAFIVFGMRPKNIIYGSTGPGVKVYRFQGSDYYKSRPLTKQIVNLCENIIFASEKIKQDSGLKGKVLRVPVNTDHFYPRDVPRDKEVCYYIPHKRNITYMANKAPKGATIMDGNIPYEKMPYIFSRHKKYVRWTTHDACPKMPYEALLCGCKVWHNGQQITDIPDYMLPEIELPKWVDYLDNLQ
jgi:hypothetical protein